MMLLLSLLANHGNNSAGILNTCTGYGPGYFYMDTMNTLPQYPGFTSRHQHGATLEAVAHQHYQQKNDVFTAESSINHQFYEGLGKRLQLFSNQDRESIHQLLGLIIDQINLITLQCNLIALLGN